MARRRYISTEISVDRRMNQLAKTGGDFAVLLYILMVPHADDAGALTGDPEELLATVVPMRRDKSEEDVTAALAAMAELELIEWDKKACEVRFPAESFYKYQTYIKPENRRGAQKADKQQVAPKNPAPPQETGKKPENQRESPEDIEQRRKTPQNAASVSPSVSVSHPSVNQGGREAPGESKLPATDETLAVGELPRPRLLGKAAEVEQILLDADERRDRQHWRDALDKLLAEKGGTVRSKAPYALQVLKGWLAGDSPPPPKTEGTHGSAAYHVVTAEDLRAADERPGKEIPDYLPPWVTPESLAREAAA